MLFFITGATLLLLNSLRDIFPELFSLDKLFEMLTSEEHGIVLCLTTLCYVVTMIHPLCRI